MKNVLIISYYFPPSGGPGVQRVLKFIRYLPSYGYTPIVLTAPENASYPVLDPSLAAEIPPGTRVYRAPLLEFYDFYRRAAGHEGAKVPVNLSTSARPGANWRERALQALRAAIFIPDGRVAWLPAGVRMARRILRDEDIALVFASGPPFTAHWIALRAAESSGLPLVLDFRDPWTRAPFYPARPGWARRRDQALEGSCVRQASAVISVNRQIRSDFLGDSAEAHPERFQVIPNGFDPADFAGRVGRARGKWSLVHTGTLPNAQFPPAFVPALRRLVEAEPSLLDTMEVRFLGRSDPELARRLGEPPLDRIVTFEGYVPHGESVQALLDSDCLLLFVEEGPQSRGILTGKLFEYLGSGKPILALAPEGEAAEVLRSTHAGRVERGDDIGAVTGALQEALAAHRAGHRAFEQPDANAVAQYSRPVLTGRLAEVFDRVLAAGS